MKPIETSVLGNYEIYINGKTICCEVTLRVFFDECYNFEEEEFETTEEKLNHAKDLNNGNLTPCVLTVVARALNCEGYDTLGSVLVGRSTDIEDTVVSHGMINEALRDLTTNILDQMKILKPFYPKEL